MMRFDPLKKYWKDRIDSQTPDVQKKLAQLKAKGYMTDELIFIQRKRPKLKAGDVFVVQPRENLFLYGLILNICSTPDCKNKIVACIFRNITHEKTMANFKADFHNLLLPPLCLFKEPWTSGYFYNIGYVDLETIQVPTYAFYHTATESIVTEDGKEVYTMPELMGIAPIGGIGSVAMKITQEIIMDPDILYDHNKPRQADFCLKFPSLYLESFA